MKIKSADFRVSSGKKVDLEKWPTRIKPYYGSPEQFQDAFKESTKALASLQRLLYASATHSVLLIFQAMDAAGKDSAIRNVFSGIDPHGCEVHSFKEPNAEELKHDFLWRTTCRLPERGKIGIFNRSYYEEVLVVRVHPEYLKTQGIPEESIDEKSIWKERFESIIHSEKHLHRNGTHILKFFLHLSKEEQRKRLLSRLDTPEKNWKFNIGDIKERKLWKQYMRAYEDAIETTTTDQAPWHIVPADDKKNAHLIISSIIGETLKGLKMAYPSLDRHRRTELEEIRKLLAK